MGRHMVFPMRSADYIASPGSKSLFLAYSDDSSTTGSDRGLAHGTGERLLTRILSPVTLPPDRGRYMDQSLYHQLARLTTEAQNRAYRRLDREPLRRVLKRINDLAVERDDVKFLIYGLNKKMPLELDITFREVVQRYKND